MQFEGVLVFVYFFKLKSKFLIGLQLISNPIRTAVPAIMLVVMVLLAVPDQCNSVRSIEECFLI